MKLTQNKVEKIKADIAQDMKQSEIAKRHKVSRSLVSDIATGRVHKSVDWPADPPIKRPGGQHKKLEGVDPTNRKVLELEAEVIHLTEERNRERKKNKASAKTQGLFRAIVTEMESQVKPIKALPKVRKPQGKHRIEEHAVMHISDGHYDQVVSREECGHFEEYNFNIACARAEKYVDTVIDWTQNTLKPKFNFRVLWVPMYGDHSSGEIHSHGNRSYYRNQFKNCFAIGKLHALMLRDLAPHFDQINVINLPGNHGRRTHEKDYHGAHDNWDYLIAEVTRLHCQDIPNISFTIPNAWSVNVDINGVGFNFSHGDDVNGNSGIPFYGMVRRQKGLIALNSLSGKRIRYYAMGHHHTLSSLSDIDGELLVNGAWVATDSYSYNRFSGYREPAQLFHGVNPKYGITWRMNVKLKHDEETKGPKRYKIDGGRDVGPL